MLNAHKHSLHGCYTYNLPPLFMLFPVGYSSWQLVCFGLGCAIGSKPAYLFLTHAWICFKLNEVGDKICIILRDGDIWNSHPRVLYISELIRQISKYPEMLRRVNGNGCLENTIHEHMILDGTVTYTNPISWYIKKLQKRLFFLMCAPLPHNMHS